MYDEEENKFPLLIFLVGILIFILVPLGLSILVLSEVFLIIRIITLVILLVYTFIIGMTFFDVYQEMKKENSKEEHDIFDDIDDWK